MSAPQDISIRLAEWYETLRAFGVSYIYHPVTEVHPNTQKVNYFKSTFNLYECVIEGFGSL